MDFRKFSFFIIIIGMMVGLCGAVLIIANQPIKQKASTSTDVLSAWAENMGGMLETFSKNEERKQNRSTGVKVLIGGCIVTIIGIGLRASAKTSDVKSESREEHFFNR